MGIRPLELFNGVADSVAYASSRGPYDKQRSIEQIEDVRAMVRFVAARDHSDA